MRLSIDAQMDPRLRGDDGFVGGCYYGICSDVETAGVP
jgi:hypothetical protein